MNATLSHCWPDHAGPVHLSCARASETGVVRMNYLQLASTHLLHGCLDRPGQAAGLVHGQGLPGRTHLPRPGAAAGRAVDLSPVRRQARTKR